MISHDFDDNPPVSHCNHFIYEVLFEQDKFKYCKNFSIKQENLP